MFISLDLQSFVFTGNQMPRLLIVFNNTTLVRLSSNELKIQICFFCAVIRSVNVINLKCSGTF